MKGKLQQIGNAILCKGLWAMSDNGLNFPDQSSPFEYKLIKPSDGESLQFPISGKYQGWFLLKQPAPLKSVKVEEKDLLLKFIKNDDGDYNVDGSGSNKFGSFTLRGTLIKATTDIKVYRHYLPKPIINNNGVNPVQLKRTVSMDSRIAKPILDNSTPREGSGRVRKVSTFMKEYEDSIHTPKPKLQSSVTGVPHNAKSASNNEAIVSNSQTANSSVNNSAAAPLRAQRLSPQITKCMDLLKEIQKLPQSLYFLEPVDHVKLGIPDYITIISKPMDFGTISANLEKGIYETPEQFADHMRLVFRNAITYNQMRDHPVHVAARELNSKFEDKFRILITNINNMLANSATAYQIEGAKLSRQVSMNSLNGIKKLKRSISSTSVGT